MAEPLSIDENVILAAHTTLRVGGPARFFARARTEEQIIDGLLFAEKRSCPVFILGGGSNIVVSDSGFPGLALKIELSGIEYPRAAGGGIISAAAGQDWDSFVQYCVDRNLAGIECLSGIPGTVGGTPVQNVGAYGHDVSEVIQQVRILDRTNQSIAALGSPECRFAYRASIFNTAALNRYIVLRVDFLLNLNGEPHIRYQDLQRRFHRETKPAIRDVRAAVLQIRESKGMFLRDDDPDCRSAGSFFKNPILDPASSAGLENRARACGILAPEEPLPLFSAPSGMEKLPAAWLIERAGFYKGFIYGNAGISSKHSLAIINRGEARTQEIMDLMRLIQGRVRELFEIDLQPEPVFVGFD